MSNSNPYLGKKIVSVHYFEINRENHPFHFEGFDNFDLGIEFLFDDGESCHVGWKNNDRPELGFGSYQVEKYFTSYTKIDAAPTWSAYHDSAITDFSIEYVSEAWRIPSRCQMEFENGECVVLFLSEELNADGTLPDTMTYCDSPEFYVFFSQESPRYEPVKIEVVEDAYSKFPSPKSGRKVKVKNSTILGALIVISVLVLCLLKYTS